MTRDVQTRPPAGHRWASLILLLTAVFMDMVDNQIVTIALPTIQRDLHASPSALQWTATGYTLAFALILITGGRLGDRFGHRALFVAGTAGFGAASLAAGAAPDVPVLLAARVAQGVFAGLMVPQVLSFIRTEFPEPEQPKAMGLFGMTFPLGGLAGPLLGGLLTEADLFGWHWRTIFLVNVPIAVAAAVGAALVMPAPRRHVRGGADAVGVLVLAAGLLAVLYPLVQGRELGWPAWTFALMAAALPLLALFAAQQRARERRGREPLIPPRLFRARAMPVGILVMLIFYCGMGAFFVLTLHLQDGLGYSPLKTALTMLPATVGIVAGNGLGMPLVPRLGRVLPMAGLALLLAATAAMIVVVTRYGTGLAPWQAAVPILLYGAGLGVGASSLMQITLAGAGQGDAGAASGVVNTVVQLGVAAGPATVGTAFFGRLTPGATSSAPRRPPCSSAWPCSPPPCWPASCSPAGPPRLRPRSPRAPPVRSSGPDDGSEPFHAHFAVGDAGVGEREEAFAFLVEAVRGRGERTDRQDGRVAVALDRPLAAGEAVHQHPAGNRAAGGVVLRPMLLGDHPGAVGVREEEVVEVVQQPGRGWHVRAGARRVRQVEQLPAVLSGEGDQAGAEPVHDLAEPGEARPGLHVLDGGGPERGQVTQHQVVQGGVRRQGLAEPGLGRGVRDRSAPAPEPARRHLYQRHHVAGDVGEGRGRTVAPSGALAVLGQQRAEVVGRPGRLLQQRTGDGHHLVGVQALDRLAVGVVGEERPVHDRLDQRPHPQAVAGADEMDGPAHQRDPHQLPPFQQRGDLFRAHVRQAGREAGVPGVRGLGLKPGQMLDGLDDREVGTGEQ